MPTSLLLPLADRELYPVLDALVAFATQCEADGDACNCSSSPKSAPSS